MVALEDKFTGKYGGLRNVNLTDFSDSYFTERGIFAIKNLDRDLYLTRDKETEIKVAIPVLTGEEWEMLKHANWLIARYKLDKGNRQKIEDYWKGKKIWDDVVSGRYGDRVKAEKAKKEAEKKTEKEKGIIHLDLGAQASLAGAGSIPLA